MDNLLCKNLKTKNAKNYFLAFLFWLGISVLLGLVCGAVGSLFYHGISLANNLRNKYLFLIYLLPLGGILTVFIYNTLKIENQNTNTIFKELKQKGKISILLLPAIFVSSILTHLFGGSAGKEGAALQIGAGISSAVSKILKLSSNTKNILITAGMGAVFSAVFGTPFAAAIFALTVAIVGKFNFKAAFPTVVSCLVAFLVSQSFGVHASRYKVINIDYNFNTFLKVLIIAIFIALISIVFVKSSETVKLLFNKIFKNKYIIIFVGAIIIILLTQIFGTDYNGAGINIIEDAFNGIYKNHAFLLKLLFTAITIGVGFKGGEIVPAFFIGATFGAVLSGVMGISCSLACAVGMITIFCGITKTPLASLILAFEMFGFKGAPYYLIAVIIAFLFTGKRGL